MISIFWYTDQAAFLRELIPKHKLTNRLWTSLVGTCRQYFTITLTNSNIAFIGCTSISTFRLCYRSSPCQTVVSGSWSHTPSSQTEDCLSGSWSHWCLKDRETKTTREERKAKLSICALCLSTHTTNSFCVCFCMTIIKEAIAHHLQRCPVNGGTATPPPLCPWRLLAQQACLSV